MTHSQLNTINNTFRMSASAAEVVAFTCAYQLPELFHRASQYAAPPLILGYASNVVLPVYYPGMIMLNRIMGIEQGAQSAAHVEIAVGAGEQWHDFVVCSLAEGWYGLENLAMIPGSVGAAPVQNVGAFGLEVSQFIVRCEVYCRHTQTQMVLTAKDFQFGYRHSVFKATQKHRYVILRVVFALYRSPQVCLDFPRLRQVFQTKDLHAVRPQQVFDAVCAIRSARLPDVAHIGTVGSFFVNPVVQSSLFHELSECWGALLHDQLLPEGRHKLFAGNLLTLLGWRGYRAHGFVVSAINPIVIMHEGGGSMQELMLLVSALQQSVWTVFGVRLVPEPSVFSQYASVD